MTTTMNNQYSAAELFDSGWRSADIEEIKEDYELTDDEAEEILEGLKEIEKDYVHYDGYEFKLDDIADELDDEIRENLNHLYAPCEAQFFFEKYVEAHEEKFGEEFIIA
jgi:hypothetical protein